MFTGLVFVKVNCSEIPHRQTQSMLRPTQNIRRSLDTRISALHLWLI